MADWKNKMDQISNKIKFQLNAKGVDNVVQLRALFDQFDKDNSGTLSKLEFEEFLSKIGVFLARQELRVIYDCFDLNKDGQIQYSELVQSLRRDMSEQRLAIVKHAFNKLANGASQVSFEDLVQKYNAPAHPRVHAREKKAETVFQNFVEGMGSKGENGCISEAAFVDYYADLNCVLPQEKESYFIDVVLKTWGLNANVANVPASRLAELEDIIFEKIRQRTHGADDEGKTVRRIFKHFDLDGYGTIEPNEFRKALETIGCLFKDHEIDAIFRKYDKDSNGKLDYEEFSNWFAIKGSGNNPNVNPVFGIKREPPHQVLKKILDKLKARGAHGIRGLGIVFRRMDNNGDKRMDRTEFMWGLKENGHDLSPSEFERIFKYFDKNNDGKISYDEFLVGLRGDMNERRLKLVGLAFKKLDNTGDGLVTLEDVANRYDVSFHPKFKSGEMSKNDILNEFMSQWDKTEADGKVTPDEFVEYYRDVSASIDDDDYFELMIRNAWHIEGGEGACQNTSIPRHLVTDAQGNQSVQKMQGSQNFNYDQNAKRFWGGE